MLMLCSGLLRHASFRLKSLCSPPDGHRPLCSGPLAVDGDHQGFLLDVERWDLLDLHTAFAIRWPRQAISDLTGSALRHCLGRGLDSSFDGALEVARPAA